MSPRSFGAALFLIAAFALLFPLLFAQETPKKYALLVGVNEYQHEKLPNLQYAVNDVQEMHELLTKNGYAATILTDKAADARNKPIKANIEREIKAVLEKSKKGDTVLLAFAGHGLQFEGQPDAYFCPSDARPFKNRVDTLVSLSAMYKQLKESFAGIKVLLVDACRNDPDESRGARSGIDADSAPRPPQGVAALFSCRAGERAFERDELKHGVFFYHVLQGLRDEAKDRKGNVTFAGLASYVNQEVPVWVAKNIGKGARQSPNLKADYSTEPVLVAAGAARDGDYKPGQEIEVEIATGVKMKFCWIPPGEAQLGSPSAERQDVLKLIGEEKEPEWLSAEAEEKRGKFRCKGFWMGKYAVTQQQWQAVMNNNPSWFCKDGGGKSSVAGMDTSRFPVEQVSGNDCQQFLKNLNDRVRTPGTIGNGKFVLPHEDEWEYAARGGKGNRQAYYFANQLNGKQANCAGNVPFGTATKGAHLKRTAEVGSYERVAPHPWGLCDMAGNVWQWCENEYSSDARVLRGGSWLDYPWGCRSAFRGWNEPAYRNVGFGFRVCFRLD